MDRGPWWATGHGVAKALDVTWQLKSIPWATEEGSFDSYFIFLYCSMFTIYIYYMI